MVKFSIPTINCFSSIYPTNRTDYCYDVGELGQNVLADILEELFPNCLIISNPINNNGTDIKVYYNGLPIIGIERINEGENSYIDYKRAKAIHYNLKGFKYKALVCNFGNLTVESKTILKNIPIIRIGFQLLPKQYHDFYAKLNMIHRRRISSHRSLKYIKNLLKSFFYRIGLSLLMYVRDDKSRDNNSNKSNKSDIESDNKSSNKISINKEYRCEGYYKDNQLYMFDCGSVQLKLDECNLEYIKEYRRVLKHEQYRNKQLSCYRCTRFHRCELHARLRSLQADINALRRFLNNTSYENRIKTSVVIDELVIRVYELDDKIQKCLNRRVFLYRHKNYKNLFKLDNPTVPVI